MSALGTKVAPPEHGEDLVTHGQCSACGTTLVTRQAKVTGKCRGCAAGHAAPKSAPRMHEPLQMRLRARPAKPESPAKEVTKEVTKRTYRKYRSKYNIDSGRVLADMIREGQAIGDACDAVGFAEEQVRQIMSLVRTGSTRSADKIAFVAELADVIPYQRQGHSATAPDVVRARERLAVERGLITPPRVEVRRPEVTGRYPLLIGCALEALLATDGADVDQVEACCAEAVRLLELRKGGAA